MKRVLGYAVQVLIVGLIFFFLVRNLSGNWEIARQNLSEFKAMSLVLSAIFLGLGFMLLVAIWTQVLKGAGGRLPYLGACKIWFSSNMGKYLPGKVWQVLGMVYLAEKRGVPKVQSFSAAVVAQLFLIVSGLLLTAICLGIRWHPNLLGWGVSTQILSGLLILICLFLVLAPQTLTACLNQLLRLLGKEPVQFYFNTKKTLMYLFSYSFCWFVFGAALFFFVAGLTEVDLQSFWKMTGAFSGALVLGFMAIVVPGGLGVREGVLAFLLSDTIPLPTAALIALLYRLWFTLAEVLLFVISFLIRE